MKSKLYILSGCEDGEMLDSFPHLTYDEACQQMSKIYEDRLKDGGYYKSDTHIDEKGFTIAFYSGWMKMSIQ